MNEDWDVLRDFLPAAWQQVAAETGALKGLRKDKSPERLLRTLLLHLACGYSLRETVVRARRAELADMSDVALLKRLRKSGAWLYRLCILLFNERGLPLAGTRGGVQLRLFDATDIKEPGKTGSLWRVHYGLRVPSLECDFFKVTATEGSGTGESFRQFPVQAGDHILADRGYCTAAGIHYLHAHGAHVCVRVNSTSLPIQTPAGGVFDLIAHLRTLGTTGEPTGWQVQIPDPTARPVPGRLCALRKSELAIRRARKALRRYAVKKCHRLRPETLVANEYIILFTTFPKATFPITKVLEWYRVRWQVELVFKRFKQLAGLGHLPKHDPVSARAWLYGKLLTCLLTEKLIVHANAISPWRSEAATASAVESLAGVPLHVPPRRARRATG